MYLIFRNRDETRRYIKMSFCATLHSCPCPRPRCLHGLFGAPCRPRLTSADSRHIWRNKEAPMSAVKPNDLLEDLPITDSPCRARRCSLRGIIAASTGRARICSLREIIATSPRRARPSSSRAIIALSPERALPSVLRGILAVSPCRARPSSLRVILAGSPCRPCPSSLRAIVAASTGFVGPSFLAAIIAASPCRARPLVPILLPDDVVVALPDMCAARRASQMVRALVVPGMFILAPRGTIPC